MDENVSKRQITSEFEVKVTIHNFTIFYSDNLSFKTPFFLFEIKSVGGSNSFDKEYTQYQFINRLFDKNNEIVSLADLNFDFFTRIDDCYWENKTLDENGYYVSSFDWASTDAGSFLQSGYEKYVITPHTGLLDYYEEIFYYRIKMPTQWFYSKLTFTLLKNSDSSEIILGFVLSGISGIILGLIIAKTARKKSGMT